MSVETLMDERQPKVLESKMFSFREKLKTFTLAGHFYPQYFQCKNRFAKIVSNDALCLQNC